MKSSEKVKEITTEDTWSAKSDHRPKRFKDFIGQDTVVNTIRGQVKKGAFSRTYLISGHFGDGKSSLGMLLAKTINNTNDDNHPNIRKFKGTVQSGIDDIRALLDSLRYAPLTKGKTVVIIEEAHGISGKSGDALLVDVENPPDHVVFILITNEDHKLKPTLRDRCKKLIMKPLNAEDMEKLLLRAAEVENVFQPPETYDKLFKSLAKMFEGRNRDALNTLSNLADISRVRPIKKEDISDALKNAVGFSYNDSPKFLALMYKGELAAAFKILSGVEDFSAFTFALLDLNTYLLKKATGINPPFNYVGNNLTKMLGDTKLKPPKINEFQRLLIDMRREVTMTSSVSPEAILLHHVTKLGEIA